MVDVTNLCRRYQLFHVQFCGRKKLDGFLAVSLHFAHFLVHYKGFQEPFTLKKKLTVAHFIKLKYLGTCWSKEVKHSNYRMDK
mgnify:CR=1 FL=1